MLISGWPIFSCNFLRTKHLIIFSTNLTHWVKKVSLLYALLLRNLSTTLRHSVESTLHSTLKLLGSTMLPSCFRVKTSRVPMYRRPWDRSISSPLDNADYLRYSYFVRSKYSETL